MKELKILMVVSALAIILFSFININYPTANHNTFDVGEKLRYRVTYANFVDCGEAVLEVKETKKSSQGRKLIHVVGTGKTLGGFNTFYKVNDVYESFIDQKGAFPWEFIRDVNEGGYIIKQNYIFEQHKLMVKTEKGNISVPLGIQDMISSFYYARTLPFKRMKVGDITEFKCFMDGEIWPLKIKYLGKEEIKIRKGTFKCLKFAPVVQEGRYFKNEESVSFYVTDDDNKIPIYVKAKIPVGTIKLHLVEWGGLKNPISKVK